MDRNQQKALGLVELLLALTILGVLVSLAIPAFSTQLERSRHDSQISLMATTLHLARSEAIKRGAVVTLCSGVSSCESQQWSGQLILFADTNRNGQLDQDEQAIRSIALEQQYRWHWSNFRQREHLAYQGNGMTHALNGTLTLCHGTNAIHQFVINLSGRVRQAAPSDDSPCTS